MRLSYFHVCLILVPLQMVAQNRITDSLNSVLDTARNERRVKTLNELFRAWLPSDPVKAIGFTREALNLAIEINDKRGVAAAYNNLGVAYRNQGALDKALQYYINALRLYEELGNKEGIAGTKSNIATIYSIKKDYGLALKYYEESYATFSELNDKPKIIASMNNLGNLNSDMQLYEKAMKYFSEAWQLSLQIGKPFADPLINIGNVYFRQGNYQRAIENYLKALELERQNNNRLSMLNIFANIGIAYTKAGQPKAAQPYLDEAEKLARELQAYTSLPELLRSKAINQYRIEATVLEFLPLAWYMYQCGEAVMWHQKLSEDVSPVCVILNPLQQGKGLCSTYRYRGLICRLFGYAARLNKYGRAELITCSIIHDLPAYQPTEEAIQGGTIQVPVMRDYYMQLQGIDPVLAAERIPINQAIKRALETVMHYMSYRSADEEGYR